MLMETSTNHGGLRAASVEIAAERSQRRFRLGWVESPSPAR